MTTAKMKKKTAARRQKPEPEVGSEAWKAEVLKARARILGGRRMDPDQSPERIAELVEQHDEAARKGDTEECKKIRTRLTDTAARDGHWMPDPDGDGTVDSWTEVQVALLMDIRRRLDKIVDRLPAKEVQP